MRYDETFEASQRKVTAETFILLTSTALSVAAEFSPQAKCSTASQVIERIKTQVQVPWRSRTVDTFKAGNPATVATGIATSFSATLDVFQRAAASGKNLIIVHESTFYNHLDETKDLNKKKPSSRLDNGVVASVGGRVSPAPPHFFPRLRKVHRSYERP